MRRRAAEHWSVRQAERVTLSGSRRSEKKTESATDQ